MEGGRKSRGGGKRGCRDCCRVKMQRPLEATRPIRREKCTEKGEKPALRAALFGMRAAPRHTVQSPWQRDLLLPPPKWRALERASRDQNHNPISVPREQRVKMKQRKKGGGKEGDKEGRGRERKQRAREDVNE